MEAYRKPYKPDFFSEPVLLFPEEKDLFAYVERQKKIKAMLGVLAVSRYWETPEEDCFRCFFEDRETYIWGREEEMIWTSGIALNPDQERILRLANREHGSFDSQHGWKPLTVIKFRPVDKERDMYLTYQGASVDFEWEHYNDEN